MNGSKDSVVSASVTIKEPALTSIPLSWPSSILVCRVPAFSLSHVTRHSDWGSHELSHFPFPWDNARMTKARSQRAEKRWSGMCRGKDAALRRPSPWPRTSQRDVPAISDSMYGAHACGALPCLSSLATFHVAAFAAGDASPSRETIHVHPRNLCQQLQLAIKPIPAVSSGFKRLQAPSRPPGGYI